MRFLGGAKLNSRRNVFLPFFLIKCNWCNSWHENKQIFQNKGPNTPNEYEIVLLQIDKLLQFILVTKYEKIENDL